MECEKQKKGQTVGSEPLSTGRARPSPVFQLSLGGKGNQDQPGGGSLCGRNHGFSRYQPDDGSGRAHRSGVDSPSDIQATILQAAGLDASNLSNQNPQIVEALLK